MITIEFADVHRLVTVKSLIEPLRRAFCAFEQSPERSHYDIGTADDPGTLLVMPAWRSEASIGVKVTTVFPHNPERGHPSIAGVYLLLEWSTGRPRALIDGRALTALRTAAVSALAADLLAPSDPEVLVIVGTGELSQYLIEGHMAVRHYRSIMIWGRDPRKAQRIASELRSRGLPIHAADDLEEVVRAADVMSCATMADSAVIKGAWLKPTAHLDLVGSFKPHMREADDDCFRGATVVVDTLNALTESGDLIGPLANGTIQPGHIALLKTLIASEVKSRRAPHTVFKSVGVALADLAAAEHILGCTRT